MQKIFFLFLFFLNCCYLCSCDNQKDQPYVSDTGTCLLEALHAIDNQNFQQSKIWLKRLSAIDPSEQFAILALQHENERETMQQLNQALQAQNDIEIATILNNKNNEKNIQLKKYQQLPQIIKILNQAQSQNWNHSQPIRETIEQLQTIDSIIQPFPIYQQWLKANIQFAQTLSSQETTQNAKSILAALDKANFEGETNTEIYWQRLTNQQNVGIAIAILAQETLNNKNEDVLLAQLKSIQKTLQPIILEMLIYKKAISLKHTAFCQKPISLSGKINLLNYILTFHKFELLTNFSFQESFWNSLSYQTKKDLLTQFNLTSQIFRTSTWKKPAPGVCDILNRLMLWTH